MTFNWTILGLPLHPLIVHATVVLIPLTTLLVIACAFSANLRARAGLVLPAAGLVCLGLVPASTASGENLLTHLPANPLITAHMQAADALLPWAVALAGASFLVWLTGVGRNPFKGKQSLRGVNPLSILVALVAVIAAVGTTVQVVHIGHLGAVATWSGVVDRQGGTPAP